MKKLIKLVSDVDDNNHLPEILGNFLAGIFRYGYLWIFALSSILVFAAGLASVNRALWYDELFTYYVSSLANSYSVIKALLRKADFYPPLDYLIRHCSMNALGKSNLAFRLPSIIFFLIALLCLYQFVKKRTSVIPALLAFCFPILAMTLRYSHEGRAYSLLFASSCLSILAWQKATIDPKNRFKLILLSTSLAIGPFSHFYGVLNYVPIFVGEIVRSVKKRQLCPSILIAIALSLLSLIFLFPFVIPPEGYTNSFWAKVEIISTIRYYKYLFPNVIYSLMASLVLGSFLLLYSRREEAKIHRLERMPLHEFVAALTFCLTPVFMYIIAKLFTNAMRPRYALATITGFAILSGSISQYIYERSKIWATAILLCVIGSVLFTLGNDLVMQYRKPRLPFDEQVISFIQKSSSPVIVSGSHLYLEMYHFLPDRIKSKPQYLIDRKFARRYLGFDTDQIDLANLNTIVSLNICPYKAFIHKTKVFLLVGDDGWLIKKITDDVNRGLAQLEVLKTIGTLKVFRVNMQSQFSTANDLSSGEF